MVRVKRGVTAHKRRKNVLKHTKGFQWGRKSKYRLAKEAVMHAWTHAYVDRKKNKRNFRQLWQIKINSACRKNGMTYSRFTNALKKNNILLDRRVLAKIIEEKPEIFEKIMDAIKK